MVSNDHDCPIDVSARPPPLQQRHNHVAFLAFPFGTHAAPLYALARRLAAAVPVAAFSFFSSAKSNASLAPGPPNLKLHDVPDGCPDGLVFDPRKPEEEIELFMAVTPGNFREGMEGAVKGARGAGITCVVSDCFLWFAGELAAEVGPAVPWVALWTGGSYSLSSHVYTDVIRRAVGVGEQAMPGRADESLGFVPGMPAALRVRDLPEGVVFGNLDSVLARLLHRMGEALPSAAAVALNTFDALDPAVIADFRTKFKRCFPVGPLNLLSPPPPAEDISGCLSWLDRRAPRTVAYVGFGTLMTPPPHELAALAEGLEASGSPFLWSLREKTRALLPAGFLDRTAGQGLVVWWTPQPRVLGHAAVGAFVTHCGWNSVSESVAGGVPMVCRPFFGDQKLNARSVSHAWGVGVGLDGGVLTKEGLVGALDVVLRTEEGEKMRERIGVLKELAVEAVGPAGSSTESLGHLLELACGAAI